jgi:hypothetical protein
MKVLTLLPRCDLQRRVGKALDSSHFVVETIESAKDCLEFARFSNCEGVLLDSGSLVFRDLLLLVKLLCQEHPTIALFCF